MVGKRKFRVRSQIGECDRTKINDPKGVADVALPYGSTAIVEAV
ncbi:MAG: hypothetical protein AAFY17_07175 [Cyanobacteria bacterium J06642_11]